MSITPLWVRGWLSGPHCSWNILLWPCFTEEAAIWLGTEWNAAKVQKKQGLHSLGFWLTISTWLWILSILSVSFVSSMAILPVWSSQLNLTSRPPSKGCWDIWLPFAGAHSNQTNNSGRQQDHFKLQASYPTPPHPSRLRNSKIYAIKQIKVSTVLSGTLGLDSMPRYHAQLFICIANIK